MDTFVWIVQIVLAIAFAAGGGMKLAQSKEKLQAVGPPMAWTEDFSEGQVKLIGTAEVLGAIGLILPAATGIVPVLTPITAVALALLMAGAAATHVRRKELNLAPASIALGIASVFVAIVLF